LLVFVWVWQLCGERKWKLCELQAARRIPRAPLRDALAIVRRDFIWSSLHSTTPSPIRLLSTLTSCLEPHSHQIYLQHTRAHKEDVMASIGGAGLGQKSVRPNPYVAAFSTALRQTYLLFGLTLRTLYRPQLIPPQS
jgi:hypothetical protein